MRCEIHRREYGLFETCAECEETTRLQREDQKFVKDLHDQQRDAEKRAHGELEAERERRHQEILDLQREQAEADERRREERAQRDQARLQAEDDWRDEQRQREETRDLQRELREGLPSFDAAFQREWLATNEAMAKVWDQESTRQERLERLRSIVDDRRAAKRRAVLDLQVSLVGQPVDALVVPPPAAARKAWRELVRAYRRVAKVFRSDAGWRVDMSQPNLMALWHLLTRMAQPGLPTTQAAQQLGTAITLPDLPKQPLGGALLACGVFVSLEALNGLGRGITGLVQQADVAPLLQYTFFFLVAVPFLLVLGSRHYAATVLPGKLCGRLNDLHTSIRGVLKALDPRWSEETSPLSRDRLLSNPEEAVHLPFTPLLIRLEEFIDENADYSQVTSADESTRQHAGRVVLASTNLRAAITEKHDLEHFTDSPEVTALTRRYAFMEAEVRRVGRQVISGLRVRSAILRLVQCPACAGPVSSETSSCPYCGSHFQHT